MVGETARDIVGRSLLGFRAIITWDEDLQTDWIISTKETLDSDVIDSHTAEVGVVTAITIATQALVIDDPKTGVVTDGINARLVAATQEESAHTLVNDPQHVIKIMAY